MKIKNLSLYNFRNYQQESINFSAGINVFYGENGQGKTNILEALYFSALGSSHRTFQESDLINKNFVEMSVRTDIERKNIQKEIRIKKTSAKAVKEIAIDKVKIKPRELIGELLVTMFSPEDLQLVKSEPALRRRFLDIQICQIDSAYCLALSRYNKILRQRNVLLKQIRENKAQQSSLEVWDEQFCQQASYLLKQRMKVMAKISPLVCAIYQNVAGKEESVQIIYKRKENGGESFLTDHDLPDAFSWYRGQLLERKSLDIERASTGIGPHRDDIFFSIKEMPARSFASQGQQRSLVLALKMAEIQLIKEECGDYPVLLLDDVMSELDENRRKNLLEFLNGKVQTFVTLTENSIGKILPEASFYRVETGNVFEDGHG